MAADLVRVLPLVILVVASACGGGGTDPKAASIDGDYVLLTVDGRNLPTEAVTPDPDKGGPLITEILLEARLEVQGSSARDIKKRRLSNSSTTTTDTVMLEFSPVADDIFITRPSSAPAAQPDTATFADGIVENGLLTHRTRSASSSATPTRETLVYSRQR